MTDEIFLDSNVYSEDMNDGQVYGGVRVVNPFKRDAMRG